MIDPLILRIISLGFALLFLLAAAHKLGDRGHFRASFEAYEIVPAGIAPLPVALIPLLELLVGLGWLAYGLFGIAAKSVPLSSAALLASYTVAIGVNLLRGRDYIDCGCSFSSSGSASTLNSAQQISAGLVLRNMSLVGLALVATLPSSTRELGSIDITFVALAFASSVLLYGAFNQLLINRNAIDSWRHKNA